MDGDEIKQLSEKLNNLETKHNDLCDILNELNLKKVVDFDELKVDEDFLDNLEDDEENSFNQEELDDEEPIEEEKDGTGF